MVIDHINGDTLDNRRSNLRECTNTENCRNRADNYNNKSGYKGVFWYTHCKTPKWVANITVDRKKIHLGYFENIEDAIEARRKAEEKYFGEYIRK